MKYSRCDYRGARAAPDRPNLPREFKFLNELLISYKGIREIARTSCTTVCDGPAAGVCTVTTIFVEQSNS